MVGAMLYQRFEAIEIIHFPILNVINADLFGARKSFESRGNYNMYIYLYLFISIYNTHPKFSIDTKHDGLEN